MLVEHLKWRLQASSEAASGPVTFIPKHEKDTSNPEAVLGMGTADICLEQRKSLPRKRDAVQLAH